MKLLFITDTHGDLKIINNLVAKTGCDAVVHAGDFGFYNEDSYQRVTDRELKLRIVHSSLPPDDKKRVLSFSHDEQREFVRKKLPLSDLPEFLNGTSIFTVPVYAVWGNHEDIEVVRRFYTGEYNIDNFFVLHEKTSYRLNDIHIFGLGGNFLVGKKLFQEPLAGGGGKIWSVLSQYMTLIHTVQNNGNPGDLRIFVSHVSPGKEPFLSVIGAKTQARLIVSGHMGAPFPIIWNEFAIRSPEAFTHKVQNRIQEIIHTKESISEKIKIQIEEELRSLLSLIDDNGDMISIGRGTKTPRWYRGMYNINLPDAKIGYALLSFQGKNIRIEASGNGLSS